MDYKSKREFEFKNFIIDQLNKIKENEIGAQILSELSSLITATRVKVMFSERDQSDMASFCYTQASGGNAIDDFNDQGIPKKHPDTIFINIGCRFLDNPGDRVVAYRGNETLLCSTPNIGKKKTLPNHNITVYEVENTLVPFYVVLVHELIHMKHYLMSLEKLSSNQPQSSHASSTESRPTKDATTLDALEYGLARGINTLEKAENRHLSSILLEYQEENALSSIGSILKNVFFNFPDSGKPTPREVDPDDETALSAIKNCLHKDSWFSHKEDAGLNRESEAVLSRLVKVIQEEFKQDSNEEQEHHKDPKQQERALKKNKQQQNLRRSCLTFVKNNDFPSLARQKNWRDLEEKRTVEEENAFRLAEGLSLRAFDENMTDGKIFMYESKVLSLIEQINDRYKAAYSLASQGVVANYVAGKRISAGNDLSLMPVPLRLLCQERVGQNAIITRILRAWYGVPKVPFEQSVQTPSATPVREQDPCNPETAGTDQDRQHPPLKFSSSTDSLGSDSSDIDNRISQTIGEIEDKQGLLEILQVFLKNSSTGNASED